MPPIRFCGEPRELGQPAGDRLPRCNPFGIAFERQRADPFRHMARGILAMHLRTWLAQAQSSQSLSISRATPRGWLPDPWQRRQRV